MLTSIDSQLHRGRTTVERGLQQRADGGDDCVEITGCRGGEWSHFRREARVLDHFDRRGDMATGLGDDEGLDQEFEVCVVHRVIVGSEGSPSEGNWD